MSEGIASEEIIIITPGKAEKMGAIDISEQIIQKLTLLEKIYFIGIGASIPRIISAVNMSSDIANVNIVSVSLDYIEIQVYGKEEAIFITLSRIEQEPNPIVTAFESQENYFKRDRTIWVGRRDEISKITNEILFKLNDYHEAKLMASGFPIITAIESALQVAKSEISRTEVCISAITLHSIDRRSDPGKKVAAIDIYLEQGKLTEYPENHENIKNKILEG